MPEFYSWAILLINQSDGIIEKQLLVFFTLEGAKLALKCTYPFDSLRIYIGEISRCLFSYNCLSRNNYTCEKSLT